MEHSDSAVKMYFALGSYDLKGDELLCE